MKKIMLLVICCLAYISVEAQSVTADQIKKDVKTQLESITSKMKFSEAQKAYLIDYLTYSAKEKAGNFKEELIANPIEDVNTDTFFTKEQFALIQNTVAKKTATTSLSNTKISDKSRF